jgi:hypothetical protein
VKGMPLGQVVLLIFCSSAFVIIISVLHIKFIGQWTDDGPVRGSGSKEKKAQPTARMEVKYCNYGTVQNFLICVDSYSAFQMFPAFSSAEFHKIHRSGSNMSQVFPFVHCL